MPPLRGLGPLGKAALERAVDQYSAPVHAPVINERGPIGNPAALQVSGIGESVADDPDAADVDWYVFDSSRVAEAAYDRKSDRLFVRWQDGGRGYVYEGVPQNEWNNFKRSQSPGKFVNRVLNSHDYHPGNF